MRPTFRALGILACAWLSYVLGTVVESRRFGRSVFEGARSVISTHFVDDVDMDSLTVAGIIGVLRYLDDPHTGLLNLQDFVRFKEDMDGEFGGIGTHLHVRPNGLTALAPIPGGPAEAAGVRPGDHVVAVDGQSTEGWTTEEATQALRGTPGSPVTLTVRRGEDTLDIRVQRDTVHVSAVDAATLLEPGIGYIALDAFTARAAEQLSVAIDSLLSAGANAIVLDLRSNTGGLLSQAIAVANLFLPKGVLIAEIRERNERVSVRHEATQSPRYPELPLAVVVDGATASAAEIVAGALRDHGRARIVGTRTFGKASVQALFPLPRGYVLRLTTARWHTPAGQLIDRTRGDSGGIAPDVEVRDTLHDHTNHVLRTHDIDWSLLFEKVYQEAPRVVQHRATTTEAVDAVIAELGLPSEHSAEVRKWIERQLDFELTLMRLGTEEARIYEARRSNAVQAAVAALR